ncbi:SDR family oxidoreductase [Gordonia sp. ABSL1-1]|uniref:SDR family NAD(P)-dependent oxidoreductase n=1 Tax=Gordonia sp. ABSL1-1 TaxID=3053923 RepID=UPI002573EFB9|nr:SDR family oxidoreductase [Gordonia sp. ABSL1-1]MDL9936568.1 SDR family oxidoreductase [Gordonia sp. ABSL1-1]
MSTSSPGVAVVVGGASGIGLASARRLRASGFDLVIADINDEAAGTVAAELDGRAIHLDVTDEGSVTTGFAGIEDLRAVVNCAGLSIPGAITELELAGWQTTVDICLTGSFLVLKHAGRHIADGGSITMIASLNGRQPGTGMAAYCAAKAGVLMLVEVAALELAERGVRVNAVSPGLVQTPLTEPLSFIPGLTEEYLENTPLGRVGQPDDVAATVAFLASADAGWMTGAAIDLNGGAHLQRYPDILGKVRALAQP